MDFFISWLEGMNIRCKWHTDKDEIKIRKSISLSMGFPKDIGYTYKSMQEYKI